jgi:hypothetical protein
MSPLRWVPDYRLSRMSRQVSRDGMAELRSRTGPPALGVFALIDGVGVPYVVFVF